MIIPLRNSIGHTLCTSLNNCQTHPIQKVSDNRLTPDRSSQQRMPQYDMWQTDALQSVERVQMLGYKAILTLFTKTGLRNGNALDSW